MTETARGLARLGGPIWLDLTRLLTRVGRGALSGIDRVEVAYLRHLLPLDDARFLVRTTRGFLLLDRGGAEHLLAMALGDVPLGEADTFSRMTLRGGRPRHKAEAALRPLAVDRSTGGGLARMVARHQPALYLNTGHSNMVAQTFRAVRDATVAVLVHDLIPVLHADLVPSNQPAVFAEKIRAVEAHADVILANSAATEADIVAWRKGKDGPTIVTARLGIELELGSAVQTEPGRYVMIGTVEPRKNQTVVLEAWAKLAEEMPEQDLPQLHIIGAAGWQAPQILMAIANHPLRASAIHYHGPLSDAETAAHLAKASGLLYPTLAEGFGLPPFEALAVGARPIVSDLPVLRDGLGDHAIYVDPTDVYAWIETIKQHFAGSVPVPDTEFALPTWAEHFDLVAAGLAPVVAGSEQEGR